MGLLSVFTMVGCRSPSDVINRESVILDESWAHRVKSFSAREVRILTWPEAVALMKERNPLLLRADEERFRAQRGIGQVYKNLLPYMQLRMGIDKRINELDTISFDDVRWDLNAYSILSGVLTLRRDVYAAELTYLRSNLLREITSREKIIELHRMFIVSRQLQITEQRLLESERALRGMPASRRSLESTPATVNHLREQLRSRQAKLQSDLMKLLDLADFRVELRDDHLPEVDYSKTPLNIADASRVGVLRRKLLAIELVGARARVTGAKLQYWPDISVFLTSGPLWTTSSGETIWWRSEDLRLSLNAYMPIDINGRIRNQVRDAKVDLEFLQREIVLRETILVSELEDKRQALVQVERDILDQDRKRALLMQLLSIEGAENLSERLHQWSEIEARRENALDQRAQLNAFFLFFDEAFWSVSSINAPLVAPAAGDVKSPH